MEGTSFARFTLILRVEWRVGWSWQCGRSYLQRDKKKPRRWIT